MGRNRAVTVMDGGMGRELIRRGAAERTGLWSAGALLKAPRTVVDVHRDFIAAGAMMITTNSYSCVPSYLCKVGMADRCAELAGLAGELAREAADCADAGVRVAGSLPPLEESYRADLVVSDAEARPTYAALARALAPSVDVFLCETMSSIRESRNAALAAVGIRASKGTPVYVSWTLNEEPGTGLRSGEPVEDAFHALEDLELDGFLFNCTHPDAIEAGVRRMSTMTDKPTGGYPNRFDVPANWTLDNELVVREREGFETEQFVLAAERCVRRGATLVGGCCGIGPEMIAALTARLAAGGGQGRPSGETGLATADRAHPNPSTSRH